MRYSLYNVSTDNHLTIDRQDADYREESVYMCDWDGRLFPCTVDASELLAIVHYLELGTKLPSGSFIQSVCLSINYEGMYEDLVIVPVSDKDGSFNWNNVKTSEHVFHDWRDDGWVMI